MGSSEPPEPPLGPPLRPQSRQRIRCSSTKIKYWSQVQTESKTFKSFKGEPNSHLEGCCVS